MSHTPGPMEAAREQWWDSVCRKGDPIRRPNLSYEAFSAGWEARDRMIATAWELLQALQDAERALSTANFAGTSLYSAPVTVNARAAIAKATGGDR